MAYPPTALTTIAVAAQQALTYKPILLCDIVLISGTILHYATDTITYPYPPPPYVGGTPTLYTACLLENSLDRMQKLTSTGIDTYPSATIRIADPGGLIFLEWELTPDTPTLVGGFKGSVVTLTFILIDKITGAVSTDAKVKFVGRADPPSIDDEVLSFKVRSKVEVTRVTLPNVPISKLCPWPFPSTPAERTAATDPTNIFFNCGYLDGLGVGDPNNSFAPFTTCDYTQANCDARGMSDRNGAIQYEPPAVWNNPNVYTTGQKANGWNDDNQAKYQSFVPLVYGAGLVKGIIANVLGDGNYVRFEVICAFGDCYNDWNGGILMVIANNVVIPHNAADTLFPGGGVDVHSSQTVGWWQYVNTGKRTGTPNTDRPYNSTGDPYGSLVVIEVVVPTTVQSSSNSLPDVLVVMDGGRKVRSYYDDTHWTDEFSTDAAGYTGLAYSGSQPIWIIMDLLVLAGAFDYSDFDINSALVADAFCNTIIPFAGVAGPYCTVDVASDGVTVTSTNFTGGGFQTGQQGGINLNTQVYTGQLVEINQTFCVIGTITDMNNLTLLSPGYGGSATNAQFLISHPRYKMNLVIQQRQSLAPLLNSIKLGCNLNIVVNNETNLLQFYIDAGLGDQQPDPISGSNDNTPYGTYYATDNVANYNIHGHGGADIADGRIGVGYVAYNFNETNILLEGQEPRFTSSLKITQSPPSDTPNRIISSFQNEEIVCEADTSTRVDTDDYQRMQQVYEATVSMEGVPNFDQLFRRANNYMARGFRGNPRSQGTYGDTGGTLIIELKTPGMQVGHLRVGHIVSVSSNKFEWSQNPDGMVGGGQLFRILAIQADSNFSIATITMAWHDDRWFLDEYGNGPDPRFAVSANSIAIRPPYAWMPYGGTQAYFGASDPIYPDPQTWFPTISPAYTVLTDGSVEASVFIGGILPVNQPSQYASTPFLAGQGTVDASSGTVPAGDYFVAIVAMDTLGQCSLPQTSEHMCRISLASTGSLLVPLIAWHPNTLQGALFVGTDPSFMSFQGYIPAVSGLLPTTLTISSLEGAADPAVHAFPMPDPIFDHVIVQVKQVRHAGPVGDLIGSVSLVAGHGFYGIKSGYGGDWASGQWDGYNAAIIGNSESVAAQPILNFTIGSSGDGYIECPTALHSVLDIQPHSGAYIIFSTPVVSTDGSGNTVLTDANWNNALGPHGNNQIIIALSGNGVTPIQVTTQDPHGFSDGDHVTIFGVTAPGNTNANTSSSVVTVIDDYDFTVPGTGNGDGSFPGSNNTGVFCWIAGGLAVGAEAGKLIRVLNPNGSSWTQGIIANDQTSITLDGPAPVTLTSDTIYIIEEPDWHTILTTSAIVQANPQVPYSFQAPLTNFEDQTILLQVVLCDQQGNTCVINQSPIRMLWVFGKEATIQLSTTFTIYNVPVTAGTAQPDASQGDNLLLLTAANCLTDSNGNLYVNVAQPINYATGSSATTPWKLIIQQDPIGNTGGYSTLFDASYSMGFSTATPQSPPDTQCQLGFSTDSSGQTATIGVQVDQPI